MLSGLASSVSLVVAPKTAAALAHIEFVPFGHGRAIVVLRLDEYLTADQLEEVRRGGAAGGGEAGKCDDPRYFRLDRQSHRTETLGFASTGPRCEGRAADGSLTCALRVVAWSSTDRGAGDPGDSVSSRAEPSVRRRGGRGRRRSLSKSATPSRSGARSGDRHRPPRSTRLRGTPRPRRSARRHPANRRCATHRRAARLATTDPWSQRTRCRQRSRPAALPAEVSTSPSSM